MNTELNPNISTHNTPEIRTQVELLSSVKNLILDESIRVLDSNAYNSGYIDGLNRASIIIDQKIYKVRGNGS